MGQKDEVRRGLALQQGVEKTVGQFRGIAEGGAALIDAFLGGQVGQDHVEAQPVEEIGVEREVGVDQKAAVHPDPAPRRSADAPPAPQRKSRRPASGAS